MRPCRGCGRRATVSSPPSRTSRPWRSGSPTSASSTESHGSCSSIRSRRRARRCSTTRSCGIWRSCSWASTPYAPATFWSSRPAGRRAPSPSTPTASRSPPARLGRRWFVNVALYLDEASAANGCLAVLPGSHCSPVALDDLARRRDHFADLSPVEAAAGDVVVHHGALVHGSPASRSAAPRRTLYFEFHPFMPSYLNGEARPGLPMSRDEVLARRRLRERARHLSSTAGSRVHG